MSTGKINQYLLSAKKIVMHNKSLQDIFGQKHVYTSPHKLCSTLSLNVQHDMQYNSVEKDKTLKQHYNENYNALDLHAFKPAFSTSYSRIKDPDGYIETLTRKMLKSLKNNNFMKHEYALYFALDNMYPSLESRIFPEMKSVLDPQKDAVADVINVGTRYIKSVLDNTDEPYKHERYYLNEFLENSEFYRAGQEPMTLNTRRGRSHRL
jgi:hypothetical protein